MDAQNTFSIVQQYNALDSLHALADEASPAGWWDGENTFSIVRQYDALDVLNVAQSSQNSTSSWASCFDGGDIDARSVRSMKSARSWTSLPRPLAFPTVRIQTTRWVVTLGAAGGAFGLVVGVVGGALAGAPPALLTFGLSLPAGAIMGGGIGLSSGIAVGASAGAVAGHAHILRAELRNGLLFPQRIENVRPESRSATAGGSRCRAAVAGAAGGAVVGGTAGGATGTVGGGVLGGALGVVAAPFTLGLSIPVGMVVGGGVGLCTGVVAGSGAGALGGGAAGLGGHAYRAEIGQAWGRARGKMRTLSDRARGCDLKLLDLPRSECNALETLH